MKRETSKSRSKGRCNIAACGKEWKEREELE
jgi:hypothetical protein